MNKSTPNNIYFIGIGGIGMSALARYFLSKQYTVYGYDKTESAITDALIREGVVFSKDDEWNESLKELTPANCMVVYTPAIPKQSVLLTHFVSQSFRVMKRAEALGEITRKSPKSLCVAGTHGKSTTSSMLAYLLHASGIGCNAFLGAISSDFNTNFLLHPTPEYTIVEADEFDRSFLHLSPYASILTNVDPDHLDVYQSESKFIEGFHQYAMKIDPSGFLVVKQGINIHTLCRQVSYSLEDTAATYFAENVIEGLSGMQFDLVTPSGRITGIKLGIFGRHNAENALASIAVLIELGINPNEFIPHFLQYSGIKRRFEKVFENDRLVFIDDYAHHPTEIRCLLDSIRLMYPNRKVTGIFQPHLFSRTRDFGPGFAEELSKLDRLLLLPIYPARELPIQGIDSEWLLSRVICENKQLIQKNEVLDAIRTQEEGVLLTIGAGDIDRLVLPIQELLTISQR
ncbi:MAG: UDP-N-acetylmuramate--L-alanine ligase [Flavobacteriales bacterium]